MSIKQRPLAKFVRVLAVGCVSLIAVTAPDGAQSQQPTHQRLGRDVLRELIEINTTTPFGSTKAAQAMAGRLKAAGFTDADVQLVGPRANSSISLPACAARDGRNRSSSLRTWM